jgi:hypothetical protein
MHLTQNARKGLAIGLAASTVLMTALTGVVPAFAAAHADGCNVLYNGTVYYSLGGQLRGFPSPEVFYSWGNGFGGVQQANAEDVARPMGPVMVYADGTLVKGPSDPLVYLVANGQKRGFTTGAVFTGLGYKFSNIQSAPANTFADLPTGANLNSATERHTSGVWVIDSTGTVWRMTATGRVGLPSMDVFNSWGKSFSTVVAANAADLAASNEGVAAAKPSCSGGGTTPPPPPATGMSVSASGPAAGSIVANTANNTLANFTFSGSGTVTSLTLMRTGISNSSTLDALYLYDGATRLTDAASIGSDGTVTFGAASLFSVSGSKTVSVKATVHTGTQGQTIGVNVTSFMTAGSSATPASAVGPVMNIATNPGGLATADIPASAASPSTNASQSPGTDVTVWQDTVTIGTADSWFNSLALKKIGTIDNSNVANFNLYSDGVKLASVYNLDGNSYVTFVPTSPYKLKVGSHVLRVGADILGGSSRTLQMSLRAASDMNVTDVNFGSGVTLTNGSSTYVVADGTSGTLTISTGALTTVKAGTSPSSNVTLGSTDQVLGRWTMTATGEPVKIDTLNFTLTGLATSSAQGLRNFRILVNGGQVGSTISLPVTTSTQITTNFTVYPGSTTTVEARADIVTSGATAVASGDLITITMKTGSSNATATNSLTAVNAPDADKAANQLTVATGSMNLAKTANYTNQTTTVPQTGYKVASFQLTGSSTEDINVTAIEVDFATSTGTTFDSSDLSNVYLKYGSNQTSVKSTPQATNSFSVSFTLVKNTVMQVDVFADLGSTITANDAVITKSYVSGTTVQSGLTTYADSNTANNTLDTTVSGQTITYGAGTVASAVSGSTPVAAILYSNTAFDVTSFDITTTNDAFTVTEVIVKFPALPTTLNQVSLKDGGTVLATMSAATSLTFTGLSIPVAANTTKTLTINVTTGNVGTGSGATGEDVTATLDSFKTVNSLGTLAQDTNDRAGSAMHTYRAVAQIDAVSLPTTTLANTNVVLNKFQVQGIGGTVGWKKLVFTVTKTSAPVITNAKLYDMSAGGTEVLGTPTLTTVGSTNLSGSIAFVATTEQQVSGTHIYELRADVAASVSNDSITSKINNGTAYAASAAYATVAGTAANVAWTDRSLNGHSESSLDWANENAMKTLPSTTQTVSR